jgi:hypothetical protein
MRKKLELLGKPSDCKKMFEMLKFPKQIYVTLEVLKFLLQKQGVEGTQFHEFPQEVFFRPLISIGAF